MAFVTVQGFEHVVQDGAVRGNKVLQSSRELVLQCLRRITVKAFFRIALGDDPINARSNLWCSIEGVNCKRMLGVERRRAVAGLWMGQGHPVAKQAALNGDLFGLLR